MADVTTIKTLQALYNAEHRCPTARLDQSMPFVAMADTDEAVVLHEIAAQDREHLHWLADLLVRRDSAPPPANYATDSAAQHYLRFDTLLPQWVRAEKALISTYQQAAPRLAADGEASRQVARIMSRHNEHLAALEALEKSRLTPAK